MIKFESMSKYYLTRKGKRFIFKDVSLELPTDRSIGILGPNGVGKSTLIRMIGGADAPSRGRVISDKRISWPVGLGGGLQGSMTARENVRFVAKVSGCQDIKAVERYVEDFAEIGSSFDEPIKTYSAGMKSRVGFGLSLAFDFDILLMDEVGAVGDQIFKQKSEALLKQKIESTKIILVSHQLQNHRKMCQSGIVIKNSQLVFHEDIEHAIADYQETYLTPRKDS